MKLSVVRVEAEGTQEELAHAVESASFRAALGLPNDVAPSGDENGAAASGSPSPADRRKALSEEVVGWIRRRARRHPHRAALEERFIGTLLDEGGIDLELGLSERSPDGLGKYLMLRASGPPRVRAGVKLYANNGKALFQLPAERAEGLTFAGPTNRNTDGYEVAVYLESAEAVEEALQLAREAFGHSRSS
jgi:hypothetical protein